MDYYQAKRELLAAVSHIGKVTTEPGSRLGMNPAQARKFAAKNFMTDDKWQVRSLANRSLVVELSYTYFLGAPLYGVTVFCVRELAAAADQWDHALSNCFRTVGEVADHLRELNEGDREGLTALALENA